MGYVSIEMEWRSVLQQARVEGLSNEGVTNVINYFKQQQIANKTNLKK